VSRDARRDNSETKGIISSSKKEDKRPTKDAQEKHNKKMSKETNELATVKYYVLNNENAYQFFDEWRFKTEAIIRKKGWSKALKPNVKIPTDEEMESGRLTAEEISLYEANTEAYDQIVMGCSGVPLGLVTRANGSARKAMENLSSKYAGSSKGDLTTLLTKFVRCKLESLSDNPDEWFTKLDKINNKLAAIDECYRKQDYELKAHLIANLPEGYKNVITKINGSEDKYTTEEIEKEICNK
jgi:hypothetical protein